MRARFRKQTTWLKIACNDDGEELVRSQKTLLMNAEVVCAMLYVHGLAKVPVETMRKEAWEFSKCHLPCLSAFSIHRSGEVPL